MTPKNTPTATMTKYKEIPFEQEDVDLRSDRHTSSHAMRHRIDKEVVILQNEATIEAENDTNPFYDDIEAQDIEATVTNVKRNKSLIQHIFTGSMLTDGTVPYYRYFIAIAVMCFFSIFLSFLSLNANNEYRRKERQATMLHERSVVKEEQRYGLSSRSEITTRLEQHGIHLIDLSEDSRLIEKLR